MNTKRCNGCELELPTDQFYWNRSYEVFSSSCKQCTCESVRQNRLRRLGYYQQYDLARYDVSGLRGEATPEAKRRASRGWTARNLDKKRAHTIVNRAIRSGRLTPAPCEVCGSTGDVEAHHEDHSKPLEVRWLCTAHYGQTRRKVRDPSFQPVRSRSLRNAL